MSGKDGIVEEQGTHADLMRLGKIYATVSNPGGRLLKSRSAGLRISTARRSATGYG